MRVAFVSTMTAAPWGGSEELWSATARAALAAGVTVGLSTNHWPDAPHAITGLVGEGAAWWPRIALQRPAERPGWLARVARRRARSTPTPSPFQPVFDFQPDIVCISQGGTFDFLLHDDLCQLLQESAVPYVVLCRFNTDDFLVHEYLRPRAIAFLTGARHLAFAAARNLRSAERQIGAHLPQASVVQSPMNLPGFSALPWPAGDVPQLACVARLDAAYKGQDLLFECLSGPEWRAREWQLSLFGDGPDRAGLEHLAAFYGLTGRVRLAGHVADVPGIWRSHHLLVLPSRAEGTPQSLIQAMICGRPAVVTDVGGNADWMTDGVTGCIAEAATTASIGRALERAWQMRTQWETIGQEANRAAVARIDRTPANSLLHLLQAAVHTA